MLNDLQYLLVLKNEVNYLILPCVVDSELYLTKYWKVQSYYAWEINDLCVEMVSALIKLREV